MAGSMEEPTVGDWKPQQPLSMESAREILDQAVRKDAESWLAALEGREGRLSRSCQALTPRARACFLAVLARLGNATAAAKAAGATPQAFYRLRKLEPAFSRAWDQARTAALDVLRLEAFRRAVEGWERPIYQRGELVGTERIYSDRLLEVLLQQAPEHRPRSLLELPAGTAGELRFRWAAMPDQGTPDPTGGGDLDPEEVPTLPAEAEAASPAAAAAEGPERGRQAGAGGPGGGGSLDSDGAPQEPQP